MHRACVWLRKTELGAEGHVEGFRKLSIIIIIIIIIIISIIIIIIIMLWVVTRQCCDWKSDRK